MARALPRQNGGPGNRGADQSVSLATGGATSCLTDIRRKARRGRRRTGVPSTPRKASFTSPTSRPGSADAGPARGFSIATGLGSASRTTRSCSASASWRFRQRGPRCGSAPLQRGICRPPGATRRAASNISTTPFFGWSGTRRNSRISSNSRAPCRPFGRSPKSIWRWRDCPARRCWRRRCSCSRAR